MTNNKTKKSKKWLKLALISTASVSTLATIPASICATNVKTTNLEAPTYVKLVFRLRKVDIDAGATISGQTVTKITKGDFFGGIKKPKVTREGYKFLGWSTSATAQTPEVILKDTQKIDDATTVYAVFDKIKMVANFPKGESLNYKWTYEGGGSAQVPFNKGDKLADIVTPTPKWTEGQAQEMVWDGKWYDKAPTEMDRQEIPKDTELKDNMDLFPGWQDVAPVGVSVKGKSTISLGETNIEGKDNLKYTAKVYPEDAPQNVDWYVTDTLTLPSDADPSSAYVEINKSSGIITLINKIHEANKHTYLFAVLAGEEVKGKTLSVTDHNVLEIKVVDPSKDPLTANRVMTKYNDTTYSIDSNIFYSEDGEVNMWKLGKDPSTDDPDQTINKTEFTNQTLYLGDNVTTIGNNFLPGSIDDEGHRSGFYNFTGDIEMNNVTSIGDDFLLNGNPAYNGEIKMVKVMSIGNNFLNNKMTYNKPISLPSVVTIGHNFLSGNVQFNQALSLPSIESIGDDFLYGCTLFNSPVTFGSTPKIYNIGDHFMRNCTTFDQKLVLPKTLTSIGAGFMYNCTKQTSIEIHCFISVFLSSDASFAIDNVPVDPSASHEIAATCKEDAQMDSLLELFPEEKGELVRNFKEAIDWSKGVAVIEKDGILHYVSDLATSNICSTDDTAPIKAEGLPEEDIPRNEFNCKIYLNPELNAIPNNFLHGCSMFDREVLIPSKVATIGNAFLAGCSLFNQNITIPSTVTTSIGEAFMWCCDNMVKTVTINCAAETFSTSDQTCATETSGSACCTDGIKIAGANAEAFMGRFLNEEQASPPRYRKLVKQSFKARIQDAKGDWHNCTELSGENSSHICSDSNEDIIDDDNNTYPRAEFNQKIELSDTITEIPAHFLDGCTIFSQALDIPASITEPNKIGAYFMHNCCYETSLLGGIVNIECPVECFAHTVNETTGETIWDDYTCSCDTDELESVGTWPVLSFGFSVNGTYGSEFASKFTQLLGPIYRNVVYKGE